MAEQKWFVVRGAKEEGPFTSRQLKLMAADGRLRPDDLVRREDVETSRPASAIKGLFPPEGTAPVGAPTEAATVPRSRSSPRVPDAEPKQRGLKKMLVIGVGVVAVLVLGSCVVVGVLFTQAKKAAQQGLAEADRMWEAGDKAAAVSKYKAILQDRSKKAALGDGEKSLVYGRLIDDAVERGDTASAKSLISEADGSKVSPLVTLPEAKAILAAVQREQQARAEVDQFTWKQPKGWWGDALKSSDLRFRPVPGADYAEFVESVNSKQPEQVAKILQHFDPHALFTRGELDAMAAPYYGYHSFSRNVVRPGEEGGYTEVKPSPTATKGKETFRKAVFVVGGKPEDGVPDFGGGVVSGTCYHGFELKGQERTKYPSKSVALSLDYQRNTDNKITGVKAARLKWIVVSIPAIFNDEKCYGWDAMIAVFKDRIEYVRLIERRENALDKMELDRLTPGGGKLAPADSDLYRIEYDLNDPARPYTIRNFRSATTTKGR